MRIRSSTAALVIVVTLAGCGGGYEPATAEAIVTELVAANLLECDERREPFPDVISCVDPDGDVTIGLTDDGALMATTLSAPGPDLIGKTWVILTYDDDLSRVEQFRDTLGAGDIFVRDDDGTMVPLTGP